MTQHTNFSERLDDLQQRVAAAKSAVRAAAAESEAQLTERIHRAQAELDQSVQNARHEVSQAGDRAHTKWAQAKADAASKMSDVKANVAKRTHQMDAKVAANDADLAEDDGAQGPWTSPTGRSRTPSSPCWTRSTPATTPTTSPRPQPTRNAPSDGWR